MCCCLRVIRWSVLVSAIILACGAVAMAQEDEAESQVRKVTEQLVNNINAGKADEVAAMFLPKGELIDEAGTVYQGQAEIKALLAAFFTQFPGVKLATQIESIRHVGPVAIEEGMRTMTAADGEQKSRFRYIAVWARTDSGWQLASFRDFADDPVPTPHDYLQPIAWLAGDWINEGADGKVEISYRWSDDNNYLLGEFQVRPAEGTPRKSTQRIGWDPVAQRIRSWLFDSDGGFSEGLWAVVEDGLLINSSSVNPDGTTATATLHLSQPDNDHFTLVGRDRVIGDSQEDDFEITVTRRPPPAGKPAR